MSEISHVNTLPLRVRYSISIVCLNRTALSITSSIAINYSHFKWIILF